MRDDFSSERGHGFDCARAGPGQAEVESIDPKRFHQVKDFDLLGDRGIADAGRLQTVAQALVIHQHRTRRLESRRVILVPVVDEVGGVHAEQLLAASFEQV